ncbi:MAG: hypothetical protein JO069_00545 [Verrucomicrobia bacterium]|nr:hypothetical protein [Verrucomicrobiota bacterium]
MKRIFLAFAGLAAMLLVGCSISEESSDDVGRTLQEGISGRGHLVQPDTTTEAGIGRTNP